MPKPGTHVLSGHRVATSDMTFAATCEPIFYEGGEAVFIDSERDTWNMSPESLENAFALYPDIRIVVLAHLYGTPAKINEIKAICDKHGAILIEDAAESLGATYRNADGEWVQTGSSSYSCISFNGNKIITGSSGGMFLTDSKGIADKVRKWSTQSREAAPWYEHEELGFNYRISNIIKEDKICAGSWASQAIIRLPLSYWTALQNWNTEVMTLPVSPFVTAAAILRSSRRRAS